MLIKFGAVVLTLALIGRVTGQSTSNITGGTTSGTADNSTTGNGTTGNGTTDNSTVTITPPLNNSSTAQSQENTNGTPSAAATFNTNYTSSTVDAGGHTKPSERAPSPPARSTPVEPGTGHTTQSPITLIGETEPAKHLAPLVLAIGLIAGGCLLLILIIIAVVCFVRCSKSDQVTVVVPPAPARQPVAQQAPVAPPRPAAAPPVIYIYPYHPSYASMAESPGGSSLSVVAYPSTPGGTAPGSPWYYPQQYGYPPIHQPATNAPHPPAGQKKGTGKRNKSSKDDKSQDSSKDRASSDIDSGSGSKDSASGSKDAGAGSKDSGSGSRDSFSGSRDSGSGSRDSGSGPKNSRSASKDSGAGPKNSRSGSKKSGAGSKDSGSGSKKTGSGSKDTASGPSGTGTGSGLSTTTSRTAVSEMSPTVEASATLPPAP